MVQYIYFVKCPECEDEHFDFFNDAKNYAISRLSKKPIITQTEVYRNDFGECTDSSDLGTVWSWEDEAVITNDEPACSVFTKDDLVAVDDDPEFAALDNFVDFKPEEVAVEDAAETEFHSDNTLDAAPDNFRKPIPAGMTIEQLVEAMEENEDTVECVCCQELYPKEDCKYDEKHGWICLDCADEVVECTWCEGLFDKSDCRYEVDLGWLCGRCEAAIKSRGEPLTFRENSYWDLLDEEISTESPSEYSWQKSPFELDYTDLEVTEWDAPTNVNPEPYTDAWYDPIEQDSREIKVDYTYKVQPDDMAHAVWNLMQDEDAIDVPGGIEALYADTVLFDQFMEDHIDDLIEKYKSELLAYFKDSARDAYEANEDYFNESVATKENSSMLETLEDRETYRKRLDLCPECGEQTFDHETGICMNCGFNILR